MRRELEQLHMTPEHADELLEVALRHPNVKLAVSALGSPPKHILERFRAAGVKVGAMTGAVEHALSHKQAGLGPGDRPGHRGRGHTGVVSSMVLWPSVVDAVVPMPVLAAGGIGHSGRQMAAAFALGAQGIWCGSIWHGTRESDLTEEMKQLLYKAKAGDAVQTRSKTGKPGRMLRSKYTEAWVSPGAPQAPADALAERAEHRGATAHRPCARARLHDLPGGPDRRRHQPRELGPAGHLRHPRRVRGDDGHDVRARRARMTFKQDEVNP